VVVHNPSWSSTDADLHLIRDHYADFNARRLEQAASRFDAGAPLEHITGCVEHGPEGYQRFATQWLQAFPDAMLSVRGIRQREPGLYEVDLLATGTHKGTLTLGAWVFRATDFPLRLPARQLLQVEGGVFSFASLSFDLQDLVRQLATVDIAKLLQQVARIHQIGDQLASTTDAMRQRELVERLGAQLDAARHLVRPYFR